VLNWRVNGEPSCAFFNINNNKQTSLFFYSTITPSGVLFKAEFEVDNGQRMKRSFPHNHESSVQWVAMLSEGLTGS